MNTTPQFDGSRSPSALPYLSASQTQALLRSAAAISCELLGGSFDAIAASVREALTTRWDFDIGTPLVQRMLSTRTSELRHAFLARIPEQQDRLIAELLVVKTNVQAAPIDLESLSLVQQVDDAAETLAARSARRMRRIVDEPLRDLNLVVGFMTGRTTLRDPENPYGPDAFMPALMAGLEDVNLHRDAWAFCLGMFERPLAEELARVQLALLDHFRTHGVDAKLIWRELAGRHGAAAASRAAGRGGPPGDAAAAASALQAPGAAGAGAPGTVGGVGTAGAGPRGVNAGQFATTAAGPITGVGPVTIADAQQVLSDLLARLQANVAGYAMPPMPAQGPVGAPLISAINELQTLGLQGVQGAVFAGTPAGSIGAWREHLLSQSTRTVDKLTIEIVGMMFDQILRDGQVPDEIKALLSRLQFPVLKAALMDAAFFASSTHPARRLIDRIASASAGWEPYGDENERFRTEIDRIVREVLIRFDRDVAVFDRLLSEFDTFLGEIQPRESDPVARAKRALEEAEKREILTINTTIQVRRAFDRVELDEYLRDFLLGAWVQVLVAATLRDDETAGFSKRFREVIHEIVWSVQPKANSDERKRLVGLIPSMTRILRDGLALIRMSQRDQDEFFQQLMASHAMAVKPTDQATYIKHSLQSSELRVKLEGIKLTGAFPMTTVPGGIRVATDALLRAAAEHHVDLSVPEPLTDVGELDRDAEAKIDQQLASWPRGSWFEIWNGHEFIKARLRWISPLRTLFMFSSGADGKAHVMSPELIKTYLRRNYIRPLEAQPLMRRAADAVVSEFEKSPKRIAELAARFAQPDERSE
ncbi:MAG: DUF1631 family protein [Burkholderiaceae bacterium]|nr:DUF1631 family protein [Burkholderiaceae bacterium]